MNEDSISRQAAIDTIGKMQTYKLFVGDDMVLVDKDEPQKELMLLPSAERKGKWIKVGDNAWKCSYCSEISCCESPYCGECGARMEYGNDK